MTSPRRSRKDDPDASLLTYGRPSTSAWIAAAAVAFAFFILGGFIRTYRQLDVQREESRAEIAALRETIMRLREERMTVSQTIRRDEYRQPRLQPLPPARRDVYNQYDQYSPIPNSMRPPPLPSYPEAMASPAPVRPNPAVTPPLPASFWQGPESSYSDAFVRQTGEDPRYRAAPRDERLLNPGGGPLQVISVANDRKRVMVEGGRDIGLTEGTRLELRRGDHWAGDLRVVEVFDNQSACDVLNAAVAPQPGDTVARAQQQR